MMVHNISTWSLLTIPVHSIMGPGVVHCAITLEPAMAAGCHFYQAENFDIALMCIRKSMRGWLYSNEDIVLLQYKKLTMIMKSTELPGLFSESVKRKMLIQIGFILEDHKAIRMNFKKVQLTKLWKTRPAPQAKANKPLEDQPANQLAKRPAKRKRASEDASAAETAEEESDTEKKLQITDAKNEWLWVCFEWFVERWDARQERAE